ncbi:MAG TPA: phosphate ABC transporter substrate-binding protein PstS [Nevskia sp.]|nr:phosphate ABC transporter substrate-binding protein PstS [Nevskia sp.]
MNKTLLRGLVLGAAATLTVPAAFAADISGAGATFPYPIYSKWAAAYKDKTGNGLNYQSIGSGGGIKQIKAKTVTFGASDKPLEQKELDDAGLTQFPAIVGGVVPVVNLKGVTPGELTLDGATLADIFLGKIKSWNDPAIAKLNPKAKLPATLIAVVHRSDGSGTSFLFTSYLSQSSAEWKEKVGAATAVEWPSGIGAKGNEGVAGIAGQTDGAIGYVEYAYAKQNKMAYTKMINKDGKTVEPKIETFAAAAANADWANAPAFYLVLTSQPGATSWPIVGASFIIVYKKPDDAAALGEALKFYDWAFKNGQKAAEELDYVPLPAKVVDLVEASWKANVKDAAGMAVFK